MLNSNVPLYLKTHSICFESPAKILKWLITRFIKFSKLRASYPLQFEFFITQIEITFDTKPQRPFDNPNKQNQLEFDIFTAINKYTHVKLHVDNFSFKLFNFITQQHTISFRRWQRQPSITYVTRTYPGLNFTLYTYNIKAAIVLC